MLSSVEGKVQKDTFSGSGGSNRRQGSSFFFFFLFLTSDKKSEIQLLNCSGTRATVSAQIRDMVKKQK